jgi:hypothetical protein
MTSKGKTSGKGATATERKGAVSVKKVLDFSKPLTSTYLARGWYEEGQENLDRRNVKPSLLNDQAFQKAYELIDAGVTSDALRGLNTVLRSAAFGVPSDAPTAPFSEEEKREISQGLMDYASTHRKLGEWVSQQALPYVKDRIDLQAMSAHVHAVFLKLCEIDIARRMDAREQNQNNP